MAGGSSVPKGECSSAEQRRVNSNPEADFSPSEHGSVLARAESVPCSGPLDRLAQKVGEHIVFVGSSPSKTIPLALATLSRLRRTSWNCRANRCIGDTDIRVAEDHGCLRGEPSGCLLSIHVENRCGPCIDSEGADGFLEREKGQGQNGHDAEISGPGCERGPSGVGVQRFGVEQVPCSEASTEGPSPVAH